MRTIEEILLEKIVISTKEAVEVLGNRMSITRLCKKDIICPVGQKGSGYYTLPDTNDLKAILAVKSNYYPESVISGPSALTLHELGLDYIDKLDIDIPLEKDIKNQLFNTHRIIIRKIMYVINKEIQEIIVKIYSPERTLYEAYKQGKNSETFYRALKRYRTLYLDKETPAKQYNIISNIDSEFGSDILRLLTIEDVDA